LGDYCTALGTELIGYFHPEHLPEPDNINERVDERRGRYQTMQERRRHLEAEHATAPF
jgi:hypothetical protein